MFKQIGRADELGSGVRKLFKYCRAYSAADPELLEKDIFQIIIPLTPAKILFTEEKNYLGKSLKIKNTARIRQQAAYKKFFVSGTFM